MNFPIRATLMYYAKICDDKKEFAGFDKDKIKGFFYEIGNDYPEIFERITERTIEEELNNLGISRIIQCISPELHPHFISPGFSKVVFKPEGRKYEIQKMRLEEYKKHEKELEEIAQRFYDELGCNFRGELGKRTKIYDE